MSAIFRQLTAGIKFDKRKYRQEAEKFGLVKKCENEEQNENFEKTVSLTLEDDFVPDSNLPTPDDSAEENNELQLLGKDQTCVEPQIFGISSSFIHIALVSRIFLNIFLVTICTFRSF